MLFASCSMTISVNMQEHDCFRACKLQFNYMQDAVRLRNVDLTPLSRWLYFSFSSVSLAFASALFAAKSTTRPWRAPFSAYRPTVVFATYLLVCLQNGCCKWSCPLHNKGASAHPKPLEIFQGGRLAFGSARCPGKGICTGSLPRRICRCCLHRLPYPAHSDSLLTPWNVLHNLCTFRCTDCTVDLLQQRPSVVGCSKHLAKIEGGLLCASYVSAFLSCDCLDCSILLKASTKPWPGYLFSSSSSSACSAASLAAMTAACFSSDSLRASARAAEILAATANRESLPLRCRPLSAFPVSCADPFPPGAAAEVPACCCCSFTSMAALHSHFRSQFPTEVISLAIILRNYMHRATSAVPGLIHCPGGLLTNKEAC